MRAGPAFAVVTARQAPTLPSVAALKGARASCPPEPGRLRHLIALGAPTSASARKVARAVQADGDVGDPMG